MITAKASSEQTGGAFNLFEIVCPIEYETPLHIHYLEDVAIYVLDGTLAIFWGDEKMQASAGSFFFQPKGTPHGFRVEGNIPARILYMTVPAGLDRFIFTRAMPNEDTGVIAAACHKIEVLGPLPSSNQSKRRNEND